MKHSLLIKLAFGDEKRVEVEADSLESALNTAHSENPGNFGIQLVGGNSSKPGNDYESCPQHLRGKYYF